MKVTNKHNDRRNTLPEWQKIVYATAKSAGWHTSDPNVWKFIGNLMAEAAEAWEEIRKKDFEPTRIYYRDDGKPEGLPIELADLVIRVLDTAETYSIDIEKAMQEKNKFNRTRPSRHGGKRA